MRGVRYSAREKEYALKLWLIDKVDILKVAKKMKCTERSLWRWKAKYDGTLASLKNGSSRPHTPHPNSHTQEEICYIKEIFENNPDISYTEALGKLRTDYSYSRTYYGFYRFVVKSGIRPGKQIEKYIEQPYFSPEMFGVKMQMDVKYVPTKCLRGNAKKNFKVSGTRFYQYTMIDETTRERFLFPYKEQSARATKDFIQRAIAYFGYIPSCIQTDNGGEFTNPRGSGCNKIHIADEIMTKLHIKHKLIKPHTPRHNGKVERSHRSDQEGFYNTLTFENYEELLEKMKDWNIRYNNRPHSSLTNREGKRVWLTPLQKRQELLDDYNKNGFKDELDREIKIRFIVKSIA